jgi:hypothetical protein
MNSSNKNLREYNPSHDYLIRIHTSMIYDRMMFEVIQDFDHFDNNMNVELVDKSYPKANDVSTDNIWDRQKYFCPATKEELDEMFKDDPIYQQHINNNLSNPINDSYEVF